MALTNDERRDIINEVLIQLRTQTDRKQDTTIFQSVIINPQQLTVTNPTVYGPYTLNTRFTKNPYICFGQACIDNRRSPLVVQPYVAQWQTDSGQISGIYLGIYALTPVPAGLTKHTITWYASGKATVYRTQTNHINWKSKYDYSKMPHLFSDHGDLENKS